MRRISDRDCPLRTMRQDPYRMHLGAWQPMLRAARADQGQDISRRVVSYAYAEIHADGLLEYGFLENRFFRHPSDADSKFECHLDPDIPVSTLAQLLVWADRLRQQASAPGAEYAIQPQFTVTAETVVARNSPAVMRARSAGAALRFAALRRMYTAPWSLRTSKPPDLSTSVLRLGQP